MKGKGIDQTFRLRDSSHVAMLCSDINARQKYVHSLEDKACLTGELVSYDVAHELSDKQVPIVKTPQGQLSHDVNQYYSMIDTLTVSTEMKMQLHAAGIEDSDQQNVYIHRKKILSKTPSLRFTKFLNTVYQDGGPYQKLIQQVATADNNNYYVGEPSIYEIPLASCTGHADDSVEQTIHTVLHKLHEKKEVHPHAECPFGLSRKERHTFCLQLEFAAADAQDRGWKEFARKVVKLEADDFHLIDEACARHLLLIGGLILEHWHRLHLLGSSKCLMVASKRSLDDVLSMMGRRSICLARK